MKNTKEKGFTLVELLAVIAIMAILVVILVPNVVNMFNGAKEDTFITQAQTIIQQAQERWILDGGGARKYIHCKDDKSTNTSSLNMQGNDMSYDVEFDSTGNITTIHITDGTYYFTGTGSALTAKSINKAYTDDDKFSSTTVSSVRSSCGCK